MDRKRCVHPDDRKGEYRKRQETQGEKERGRE